MSQATRKNNPKPNTSRNSESNFRFLPQRSVTRMDADEMEELRKKRRAQLLYICKVYVISLTAVALAIAQWSIATTSQKISCWLQRHKSFSLPVIFLGFFGLLLYSFFYSRLLNISRYLLIVVALLTMEINTIILMRPVITASNSEITQSAIITLIATIVFFVSSLIKHSLSIKEKQVFIIWTARLFITTELGFLAASALRNHYIDLIFVFILLVFYTVLCIYFTITLGSTNFHENSTPDYLQISTLLYYNFLALFSHVLMFIAKLHNTNSA